MLPTILIVLFFLPFIGEASAKRSVAERSAVAKKAVATRKRGDSSQTRDIIMRDIMIECIRKTFAGMELCCLHRH